MSKFGYEKHLEVQRTDPRGEEYHTGNANSPLPQNIAVGHSMVKLGTWKILSFPFYISSFFLNEVTKKQRAKGSLPNSPEQTNFV